MPKIEAHNLEAVAQLLAKDPATYKAYGPYWWSIKKWLHREHSGRLHFLGEHDEPEIRAIIEECYPDELDRFKSALNHYKQKAIYGELYLGHSYLPNEDETDYDLYDPDMDAASGFY